MLRANQRSAPGVSTHRDLGSKEPRFTNGGRLMGLGDLDYLYLVASNEAKNVEKGRSRTVGREEKKKGSLNWQT